MELTKLKNILNTGEVTEDNLPGYSIGKVFLKGKFLGEGGFMDEHGAAIGTAATGVLDMVNGIGAASKYNKTADDLLQDAGKSQSNIGGVGYTVQNDINKSAEEAQVDAETKSSTLGLAAKGAATGAAIASVIPGVGTAVGGIVGGVAGLVGGLFGGASKKREMKKQMRLAEIKRINTNDFNRSGALTTVLLNDLALTEGNQEDQALYGAANGKESYSAGGPTSGYNARVSNGEIIANKFTGEMFRVPGIPNNKDGKLAFIRPSDTIISNKYGLSDYVANTGDLEGGEAMQGTIMKALGKRGYKNGKLPGFVLGLEAINAIGNLGLGALSMWDSYNKRREPVKSPNTYVGNPYENTALYGMAQLRDNPYPIMGNILDHAAKVNYAADNAGGLGGGQRAIARQQNALDVYNSISTALSDSQLKNNKLRMAYLDAAANMGDKAAARQMQANQWDLDYYSRAHGAREKMADQRRADALTFLQSYLKGVNDIGMFNKQMDLYWADYYAKHPEKDPNNPSNKEITPSDMFSKVKGWSNDGKTPDQKIEESGIQLDPAIQNMTELQNSIINPKLEKLALKNKRKIDKQMSKYASDYNEALKTSPYKTDATYEYRPYIPTIHSTEISPEGKEYMKYMNMLYNGPKIPLRALMDSNKEVENYHKYLIMRNLDTYRINPFNEYINDFLNKYGIR